MNPEKGDEDAEFEFIEGGDDEDAEDESNEELTVEAAEEPVDEWKLVEMARIAVEQNGGSPDYETFEITPEQHKKFEIAFEFWTSVPLDKHTYTPENLNVIVRQKGADLAGNEDMVNSIHEEALNFYQNCPDFDSEEEFRQNVHQKEKINEKVEAAKRRGKDALLGAFGGQDG